MGVLKLNVNTIMSKTLKVITPFFTLNIGDVLTLSDNGRFYESIQEEKFGQNTDDGGDFESIFSSSVKISVDKAKEFVEDGYLSEETDAQDKFVNVFDEIDTLLNEYKNDLKDVNADKDDVPACLKVEKTTVLTNLIKVLTHLKNLKK